MRGGAQAVTDRPYLARPSPMAACSRRIPTTARSSSSAPTALSAGTYDLPKNERADARARRSASRPTAQASSSPIDWNVARKIPLERDRKVT